MQSNNKVGWGKLPNENKPGDNPYSMSFPETERQYTERHRLAHKEMGETQFSSTCRTTKAFEDKVKVNSNNNMEGINKGYLMTTNKDPRTISMYQPVASKIEEEPPL